MMCRPIFWLGNDVVCVAKVITQFETKGFYAAALTKKRRHWLKGVPCDLIDTQFEEKEVSDVGIIEAKTEDKKLLDIFFMEEIDYVM